MHSLHRCWIIATLFTMTYPNTLYCSSPN